MIAQSGVGDQIRFGPVEGGQAPFGRYPLPMHLGGEDPTHLGLLAEFAARCRARR